MRGRFPGQDVISSGIEAAMLALFNSIWSSIQISPALMLLIEICVEGPSQLGIFADNTRYSVLIGSALLMEIHAEETAAVFAMIALPISRSSYSLE